MISYNINHKRTDIDLAYYGSNKELLVQIGAGTYTDDVVVFDYYDTDSIGQQSGLVIIGRYCSVSSGVQFLLYGNHNINAIAMGVLREAGFKNFTRARPREVIRIGHDVWIGKEVMLLKGIQVGDGAVLGARAVVTSDVPPYAVVAGNPARIVKYRFSEEKIEALLRIKWWDWPSEKIAQHADILMREDIDDFIKAHLPE